MKKLNRRQFLGTAAGVLLLSVSSTLRAEEKARFVAVRLWPAEAYTRATIESSAPLRYNHFRLSDPERFVVDIEQSTLNDVLQSIRDKVLERDPYIKSVRVSQNDAETVRIVFDLKTKVDPQIFTLAPVADFRHRLVIDFYPRVLIAEEDPLMALLQDYRNGEIRSDGSTGITAITNIPERMPEPAPVAEEDVLGEKIREILDNRESGKPGAGKPAKPPEKTVGPGGKKRQIIVVLDPGHGGEDPGAVGPSNLYEKNVVLKIARECRDNLQKLGYKVYMTRNEDVFIPLRVRVAKARTLKADAFVSIHADAFTNPAAHGTGVYVLSKKGASSSAAGYLAKTQNLADVIGGVRMGGDAVVEGALFDLMQTATMNDSLKLAQSVLNGMSKINKLHKGHVERAAFAVLKAPDIPSILVETAFISNPVEEKLLASASFRAKIARSISSGVHAFFKNGVALR